jgi:hypothetical protein
MPTLTYWIRIEPSATAPLERTLRAELRDPLWILARQWQLGELAGEDAASPAFVELQYAEHPLPAGPAEPQQLRVRPVVDLPTRIGAAEALLGAIADDTMRERLRAYLVAHYPLPAPESFDRAGQRLHRTARKRWFDGIAAVDADATNEATLPPADRAALAQGRTAMVAWIDAVVGRASQPAASRLEGWDPARLRQQVSLIASSGAAFRGEPGPEGEVDWYALDFERAAGARPATSSVKVLPAYVTFRGMPNHRFWDFEDGGVDLDAVIAGPQELTKALVLDFITVHGNDWYVVPVEQHLGSAAEIVSLSVTDVFGLPHTIEAASTLDPEWAMFTPSGAPGSDAPRFLVLPVAAAAQRQSGEVLEEVHFVRDESANLVWAIESRVRSMAGHGLAAERGAELDAATTGDTTYRLMTHARSQWHAFEPIPGAPPRLERVIVANLDRTTRPGPRTLVLTEVTPPHRLADEEVPRAGTRVTLRQHRCRGADGVVWTWAELERDFGRGEVRSSLEFDVVDRTTTT